MILRTVTYLLLGMSLVEEFAEMLDKNWKGFCLLDLLFINV